MLVDVLIYKTNYFHFVLTTKKRMLCDFYLFTQRRAIGSKTSIKFQDFSENGL